MAHAIRGLRRTVQLVAKAPKEAIPYLAPPPAPRAGLAFVGTRASLHADGQGTIPFGDQPDSCRVSPDVDRAPSDTCNPAPEACDRWMLATAHNRERNTRRAI